MNRRSRKIRIAAALAIVLFLCNLIYLLFLHQYRYRYVVLHHTASRTDNYSSIREFHIRKHGWRDAGYHLVLSNGSTEVPEGYLEATGRYRYMIYSLGTRSRKHNILGVHLCVVGDYDNNEPPELVRNSLANAVARLQDRFHIPASSILLHRDCNSTVCPGRHITADRVREWIAEGSGMLPAGIRAQHDEVIDAAGLSVSTIRLFALHILVLNLGCVTLLAIALALRSAVGILIRRLKPRRAVRT